MNRGGWRLWLKACVRRLLVAVSFNTRRAAMVDDIGAWQLTPVRCRHIIARRKKDEVSRQQKKREKEWNKCSCVEASSQDID
jgi:hypothetical protein